MVAQNTMPERLGPYRLFERIGEGGMGVVHLARDSQGRAVAIKVLRPMVASDSDARRRLGREFETMGRVRSPFVAEVIDADVIGDMPYVVTRYVAGPSLDQLIRDGGPLRGQALERLAWGLAEGLAAVHAAGVVHRDLKPGNVVMAGGAPVLIDFGIAHVPDATRITQTGMFMGTPGYLAPEVVEGQPSGPSADVHSWGSTVAFAATSRAPFGTGTYETIFYRIIRGTPDLNGVPSRLMPLLDAALARDPARRPSAAELSERCAAIDLTGPDVPVNRQTVSPGSAGGLLGAGAGAAALAGAAGPGTSLDGPVIIPGTPDPGLRHWTRDLPLPPGSVKDDFADLLPPVSYPPAGGAPGGGAPPPGGWAGATAKAPARQGQAGQAQAGRPQAGKSPAGRSSGTQANAGFRRLLSLVTMGIAVAASVLLPVAGTAVSLALIVLLRAADLAHSGLTRRRSERGTRASDVPVMVIKTPWAVIRALLGCLLLAPLALTCGAIAAAVTIIAVHASPLQSAGAYAAGAVVAFYGFGPGSVTPRRQLGRIFGVVTRQRFTAAIATVVLTVIALGAAAAAVTQPHHLWPLTSDLAWRLRGVHDLMARLQVHLQNL